MHVRPRVADSLHRRHHWGVSSLDADVLVVGAGPAGSAAAAWSARAGMDTVLLDAEIFPRDKPCGDGLTPRAIAELDALGLADWLEGRARNRGLRAAGFGQLLYLPWPGGNLPDYGGAAPRVELDHAIRQVALDAGARPMDGARAVDVERNAAGRVTSVTVKTPDGTQTITCRRLVVAATRLDVAARCDAVRRIAMPLAAELATELRTGAVSDDKPTTGDRLCAGRCLHPHRRDATRSIALDVDSPRTFKRSSSRIERYLANGVVQFHARGGTAVVGQIAAGPGEVEELAESRGAQTAVAGAPFEPIREAQGVELRDRAGGEPVTTRLVARKCLGVKEDGVHAGARRPGSGGRPRRAGSHDQDIGVE